MGCAESKVPVRTGPRPEAVVEVEDSEPEQIDIAAGLNPADDPNYNPDEIITVRKVTKKRVPKKGTAAAAAAEEAAEREVEIAADDSDVSDTPLEGAATARQGVRLEMEQAFWKGEVSNLAITQFMANYDRLVAGEDGMVPSTRIKEVGDITSYSSLADGSQFDQLLKKTVCLKLNGGLGTGMGLTKAKSLLPVRDGKTFLDIIAAQMAPMKVKGMDFMLMNSFSTEADTKAALDATGLDIGKWEKINLLQNKVPKVHADSFGPATHEDAEKNWCPPGHGDLYTALSSSGKLAELAAAGKEYLFVSNSDNLGATVDPKILQHFANSSASFMMEVCKRTQVDKKGGHLARNKKTGKLLLRESAQVADDDQGDFENIDKYQFFNTNNLWIKIPDLKRLLAEAGGVLKLPLIVNRKSNDPADGSSDPVIQLETAMGAAIALFDQEKQRDEQELGAEYLKKPMSAEALLVPRTRFAPVKTCNDLLSVRSDAYEMVNNVVQLVASEPPKVSLGPKYKKIQDFEKLFENGIPSMKECKVLDIVGGADLTFQKDVVLKGEVYITVGDMGLEQELKSGEYTGEVQVI